MGDPPNGEASDGAYRWLSSPRWYLREGGFFVIARADGVVPRHAHHAIQIVIALDGTVAICGGDDQWRQASGVIVRPDAAHAFNCAGAMGAMVFVDPESREGAWLGRSLTQAITVVPEARLASSVVELRRFVDALYHDADVGLPFSRYMLWRKMTRAMVLIASERTIAAAAHAADFADAAHLTRTLYQMVGMAPSVLMRGDFVEIPSPFTSAGDAGPHGTGSR